MSYFKTYNKIVNESLLGRIGQEIQTMSMRSAYNRPQREKESRERENKVDHGLDEIYKDDTDKKDYPDLSKQYVHV